VNARDLQRYKGLLLTKLDELSAARAKDTSPVLGAGVLIGDLADQANADTEAELEIQLRTADGRLVKAIEDALTRLRAGAFGVCEACKQPIARARLEAVPWTHLCRDCKEQQSA
jgi:DnaK suppressor protein